MGNRSGLPRFTAVRRNTDRGRSTRRGSVRLKRRKVRRPIWATAILAIFAACLTDESVTSLEQSDSRGNGSGGDATTLAAVTLPPGEIIDTQLQSGWTEGNFSVNHSGAAEYGLPLWVPAGRRGVQPALALRYSSQAGNGLVGVGWSLSGLSAITPCPRTVAQDDRDELVSFTSEDAYCLDGMRLRPTEEGFNVEQEYRTEQESFSRIISYAPEGQVNPQPSEFKVWTKDGQILTFGESGGIMTAHPLVGINPENPVFQRDPAPVKVAWLLRKIEDRNGNAIDIEYERIDTPANMWSVEMRPKTITYGPNRKVEFGYELRPDPLGGFRASSIGGVHTVLSGRLKTIKMSAGQELLRAYTLDYRSDTITGRSLLTRVTECDGDIPPVCMNALEFDWSGAGTTNYEFEVVDTNITDVGVFGGGNHWFTVGDVNGDGSDDLIYGDQNEHWKMRLATGAGFGAAQDTGIPHLDEAPLFHRRGIRTVDYDRDGRVDILTEVPGIPGWKRYALYRSTGSSYVKVGSGDFDIACQVEGAFSRCVHAAYFADLDGNGFPDYVAPKVIRPTNGDPFLDWRYRLNNQGTFGPMVSAAATTPLPADPDDPTHHIRITAFTGRTPNFLLWNEAESTYDGLEWDGDLLETSAPNLPFVKLPENEDRRNLHFADVNCDGLEDAVYPYSGLAVQLNSGAGFSHIISGPSQYHQPPPPEQGTDLPVRVVDFNGDGCDDVLLIHPGQPSSASDFYSGFQVYSWRNGGFHRKAITDARVSLICFLGDCISQPIQALDLNRDGALDIAQVVAVGTLHLQIVKRVGGVPDKLTRVRVVGLGARVEFDYTTLADGAVHIPGTCVLPVTCLRRGGSIVAKHRVANGMDTSAPWHEFSHKYRHARADALLGWLGFEEHEVRDEEAQTNSTVTTFFDNTTRRLVANGTGTNPVYPFANLPKGTRQNISDYPDGSLTEYERTTTTEFSFHQGSVPGTYVVQRDKQTDSDRESNAGPWVTLHSGTVTFSNHDQFGNPATVRTDVPGSSLVNEVIYRNDETNWLLGLPTDYASTSCATVVGVQECATRTNSFDYHDNGNLKEIVVEPDDPDLRLVTALEYGQFGNVSAITASGVVDASGTNQDRRTTVVYDGLGLFVKKVTNPLGHVSEVTTHSGLGVPLEVKDANLVPTTMKFDRFGRRREVNHANGYFERYAFALQSQTKIVANGAGAATIAEIIVNDVLGRTSQHGVLAFDGDFSIVETRYDRRGRVSQVSRPHFSVLTPSRWTTFTYDNRHRLRKTVGPGPENATVRHQYINRETHTFDAKGTESFTLARTDGRLALRNEDDPESASWLQTRFEYGPFGVVRRVTAADNATQTTEYDVLGRPTKHIDPSTGTTTAQYNAFGETIKVVNGAGEAIGTDYDLLGRPSRVTSPDGATTNEWDLGAFGKGRLQRSITPDGVATSYGYNDKGQTTLAKWVVEDIPYQINVDYDDIGRLHGLTYPDIPGPEPRFKVNYNYKQTGYLETITNAANGDLFWRADDHNAAGQLTKETYGNLTFNERTYSASTGELDNIRTYRHDGSLLDQLHYDYDLNGNVLSRWDVIGENPKLQIYEYDTLNRLTSWEVWGQVGFALELTTAYDYNRNGNLDLETVTGRTGRNATYLYGQGGAPPHAVTQRNGQSYTYDAAGRQIAGPSRTIDYNRFNLPSTIAWGNGQTTEFTYDTSGARVLKRDANVTTTTIAGLFERRIGNQIDNLHHVLANGRAVAQVAKRQTVPNGAAQTDVIYLHEDGQGSIIQTTNAAGQIREESFYDPWGRRTDRDYNYLAPQHRVMRRGYTAHDHDDELDLINMQGRIYDPVARHFISPDPFIQDPLSSQSYNRYSYAWNNPVSFVDPSGFAICDIAICISTGGGGGSSGGGGGGGGGWYGWGVGGLMLWPSGYQEPQLPSHLGWHPRPKPKGQPCPISGGCPNGRNTDDAGGTDTGGNGLGGSGGLSYGGGTLYAGPGWRSDHDLETWGASPVSMDGEPISFLEVFFVEPLCLLMGCNNAWAPGPTTVTQPRRGAGEEVVRYGTFIGVGILGRWLGGLLGRSGSQGLVHGAARGKARDIAMGMKRAGLDDFAKSRGAAAMDEWEALGLYDPGLPGWGQAFHQAMTRTLQGGGKVHFNLTGLDIPAALAGDSSLWVGRYTAWELQQIVSNPAYRAATTFYLNGKKLSAKAAKALGL